MSDFAKVRDQLHAAAENYARCLNAGAPDTTASAALVLQACALSFATEQLMRSSNFLLDAAKERVSDHA